MTCDETLWPCWVCRVTAVGVEDSARMSGGSGGLDGRLGQQIKTAPAVRQHCGSGASPTIKESTDG